MSPGTVWQGTQCQIEDTPLCVIGDSGPRDSQNNTGYQQRSYYSELENKTLLLKTGLSTEIGLNSNGAGTDMNFFTWSLALIMLDNMHFAKGEKSINDIIQP